MASGYERDYYADIHNIAKSLEKIALILSRKEDKESFKEEMKVKDTK